MWLRFGVSVTWQGQKKYRKFSAVRLVFQCEYSMFMEVIIVLIITHRQCGNTVLPVLCFTAQKKPVC